MAQKLGAALERDAAVLADPIAAAAERNPRAPLFLELSGGAGACVRLQLAVRTLVGAFDRHQRHAER